MCSTSRVTVTVRVGVVMRAAITSSRSRCSNAAADRFVARETSEATSTTTRPLDEVGEEPTMLEISEHPPTALPLVLCHSRGGRYDDESFLSSEEIGSRSVEARRRLP